MLKYKRLCAAAIIAGFPWVVAAQTVIKQNALSFEGCLKVIDISTEQIGAPPKLTTDTEKRRVAEFSAPDGTVVIECDRETERVTISIK